MPRSLQQFLRGIPALCLCLTSFAPPLRAQKAPQNDTQFWTEVDLSASLSRRVELTLPFILRDTLHQPNPLLVAPGALLDVALQNHLIVTGGYLFADVPHVLGGLQVHVPLAAVTAQFRLGPFRVADRNRAEILQGFPHNPVRYRNRLTLDLPAPSSRPLWHVFLTDEAFYDFSAEAWNQNRLQAGAGRRIAEKVSLDLYYLLRNVRQASPGQVHVIGATFNVRLH